MKRLALRLAAFATNRRGATAVEFALVGGFAITFLLAILQVAAIYLAKGELAELARNGQRAVLTGQAQTSGATASALVTTLCANNPIFLDCRNLKVSLTPQAGCASVSSNLAALTYDANGNISNNFNYNLGSRGQIMVLQLYYSFPVIGYMFSFGTQPNGLMMLTSTVVFVNEPAG